MGLWALSLDSISGLFWTSCNNSGEAKGQSLHQWEGSEKYPLHPRRIWIYPPHETLTNDHLEAQPELWTEHYILWTEHRTFNKIRNLLVQWARQNSSQWHGRNSYQRRHWRTLQKSSRWRLPARWLLWSPGSYSPQWIQNCLVNDEILTSLLVLQNLHPKTHENARSTVDGTRVIFPCNEERNPETDREHKNKHDDDHTEAFSTTSKPIYWGTWK